MENEGRQLVVTSTKLLWCEKIDGIRALGCRLTPFIGMIQIIYKPIFEKNYKATV